MLLNPIPIQWLTLLAFFILRFGVGIILLHLAIRLWQSRGQFSLVVAGIKKQYIVWPLIIGKVIIALMLLAGWYTQYAAAALMLMCLDLMITRRWLAHPALPPRVFYALLFFAASSLLITGAGAFAVDLPI
ncbi:hypothetical protein CL655_02100 [bacterium]|nr:hypothetical protein [bacterium]|tara:strand:- start:2330 stop:2722 length:393 start_codon:yes stop_codon:yes gene_type:complete